MPLDSTVSQTALVIIAIAASIQSLVLVSGAWLAMRAFKDARVTLVRRLDALEARADAVTEATQRASDSVERCVTQFSTLLHRGERITGAVANAVATSRTMLLAGVASRLLRWRRHRVQ